MVGSARAALGKRGLSEKELKLRGPASCPALFFFGSYSGAWAIKVTFGTEMTVRPLPARHWRSYGDAPLPRPPRPSKEPFRPSHRGDLTQAAGGWAGNARW